MLDFFRSLWPVPVEGNVTFFLLDKQEENKECIHVSLHALLNDPDPEDTVRDLREKADGRHVYFGLGLRDPAVELTKKQKGKKGEIVALPAFPIDIDIADEGAHKSTALPKTQDDVIQILTACPHPPSIVVNSGYGIQAFWVLASPLVWMPGQHEKAEKLIKQFQAQFHVKAAELGFKIDDTSTVQRIWRMPGYYNVKDKKNPRLVTILGDTARKYQVEQLVATGSYPATPQGVAVAAGSAGLSPSPRVESTQAGGTLDLLSTGDLSDVVQYLRVLSDPERRLVWHKILAGEVFALPGKREAALFDAANSLLGLEVARKYTDVKLADLFNASLATMAREQANPVNPPPVRSEVLKKLFSARRHAQEKEAAKQEDLQALKLLLPQTSAVAQTLPGDAQAIPLKHNIIFERGSYYLYDYRLRTYSPVKGKDDVLVYLRDAWVGSPCELRYVEGDRLKEKTLPMLLRDYGTNANQIVYDMGIDKSRFDDDVDNLIFSEAVARQRVTEAVFVPEVDRWLRLLFAGEHLEKALDWVATVTLLSRQTCALYLSGPQGVGKTFLAHGLARLWTSRGGPTEYVKVIGNFNDDLLRCPLVLADEHIPQIKDHPVLATIRDITGTSMRTVSKKFLSNASLFGAIRIIMCANNERLLASARDDMNDQDLDATCRRILHIPIRPEATAFFQTIGQAQVQKWINGDWVAKHALWLKENRKVNTGGRFLVEGPVTSRNRRLLGSGGLADLINEWLARYALNPSSIRNQFSTKKDEEVTPKVRIGGGFVLVNTDAIIEYWDDFVRPRGSKPPTSGRVSRVLSNLGAGQERFFDKKLNRNTIRYHKIEGEIVRQYAEEHNIGDLQIIIDNLERTVEENEIAKTKEKEKTAVVIHIRGHEAPLGVINGSTT